MLSLILGLATILNQSQPTETVQDKEPPPPVHYQSPEFDGLVKKWFKQWAPPEMTEEEFNIEADRIKREGSK
jgi:hypothetical protein